MYRTIKEDSFDKMIYFGVTAVDGSVNESPMSNIVSVFVAGPTTTTTTPTVYTSKNRLGLVMDCLARFQSHSQTARLACPGCPQASGFDRLRPNGCCFGPGPAVWELKAERAQCPRCWALGLGGFPATDNVLLPLCKRARAHRNPSQPAHPRRGRHPASLKARLS